MLCMMILIIISCTDRDREFGGLSFEFMNTTVTPIKILNYWNETDQVVINPGSLVFVTKYEGSGIHTFGNEIIPKLNPGKIVVIFNSSDTVSHYNDYQLHTGKYLNLSSERCLYNKTGYTIQKKRPYETALYTFIQTDYDFTKQ